MIQEKLNLTNTPGEGEMQSEFKWGVSEGVL